MIFSFNFYKLFSSLIKKNFYEFKIQAFIIFFISAHSWRSIFYSCAFADAPRSGQIGFQDPATPAMVGIVDLHHEIMFWVVSIVIFVLVILIIEIYWFSLKSKKSFSIRFFKARYRFTTCPTLETVWTLFPIYILWSIAGPSLALLYSMEEEKQPSLTLKIVGRQWYWSYELMDFIEITPQEVIGKAIVFDSYMNRSDAPSSLRLLDVDYPVYLPAKEEIRLIITSDDVIHSWTVPAFGVKMDAIPGRLNSTFLFVVRTGVFYGQCSELCGVGHGFMPITVVSAGGEVFTNWVLNEMELSGFSKEAHAYYNFNKLQ